MNVRQESRMSGCRKRFGVRAMGCWVMVLGLGVVGASLCARECVAAPAAAPATTAPTNLVLSNSSFWRCYFVLRRPVARVGEELKTYDLFTKAGSSVPPANWSAADFDDQNWTRLTGCDKQNRSRGGPFFPSGCWWYNKYFDGAGFCRLEGTDPSLAVMCLRGKFTVADPAKAGDQNLKLSLAYRGGVVVYLNGQEIARATIPQAEKANGIEAMAEDYPKEAFVTEDGKVLDFHDTEKLSKQLEVRIRKLNDVVVPAKLLRKGVNVLAIEAHRAAYQSSIRNSRGYDALGGFDWCTVGLPHIALTGAGTEISPNLSRPAGVQVWNQDPQVRAQGWDYGDPCEQIKPIKLVAAKNGSFSGEVVVGSSAALRGIKAVASDLTGAGTIAASNIQIRYGLTDQDGFAFEMLSPDAPSEVAVDKAGGGAVMPVWVTVKVPADAKAGDYKGAVTINVDGAAPVAVPVELHVANWALPDPKAFISHLGLTESPESVAMKYKVALWSPEHWALLDKMFELMGEAGAKDLFITAIRRTHHGNEHAMIRFIRQPDGTLKPDFSIAEKYLDLAIKHLGKVPVVCVYCWEMYTGGSYMGNGKASEGKGMLYTILDPATGKLEEAESPRWGTPQVREFWKPVFAGMQEILKKRGLEGSLMVGVSQDCIPSKAVVDDLKAVAPDARWLGQSHGKTCGFYGCQMGYYAYVWGAGDVPDPADKRLNGWKNPFLMLTFPREGSHIRLRTWSPLANYRAELEGASVGGLRGIGRVGADFWNVLDTPNKTYEHHLNLIAHYPESDWGQLYLGNSTPYVLAAGPHGPLATARFEMIREGAQDLEPRVFLEKALLDTALRARLGEDLAKRCQDLLDERVRAIRAGLISAQLVVDYQERLARLYDLAAEVTAKLGK